jgi:RNA-directed DNA polymerase
MPEEPPVNTDAPWPDLEQAWSRVLEMQAKLHRWAGEDQGRRFDDLFNLVTDPHFLAVAWERVSGNTGGRTAGVDGLSAWTITALAGAGAEAFLRDIRTELKAGTFRPLPVRERMIPKLGTGKKRRLGIPTVADRIVQAALKLVLEPIFERDFEPCSYGFRPSRRCQDAIAEIHLFTSRGYEWVLEADIEACFDRIDHMALMDRVRHRIGDKRVLALVKAFLKAGILTELGRVEGTASGTPQGGILSPLLANIALSTLDEHFMNQWRQMMTTRPRRESRRRRGLGTWRLVRYADDFVVLVHGTRAHADALHREVAEVLAPMGLTLSPAKTHVVHIDDGFDFLGFRIQRRPKPGTGGKRLVYTWPAPKAQANARAKIRALTTLSQPSLEVLLRRVNAVLRGWANYFRHAASSRVFQRLRHFTWWRVIRWIRKRHKHLSWKDLRRRFITTYRNDRWAIIDADGTMLTNITYIPITRYRYRGAAIPTPWTPANP